MMASEGCFYFLGRSHFLCKQSSGEHFAVPRTYAHIHTCAWTHALGKQKHIPGPHLLSGLLRWDPPLEREALSFSKRLDCVHAGFLTLSGEPINVLVHACVGARMHKHEPTCTYISMHIPNLSHDNLWLAFHQWSPELGLQIIFLNGKIQKSFLLEKKTGFCFVFLSLFFLVLTHYRITCVRVHRCAQIYIIYSGDVCVNSSGAG